jgi:hypothetical protein
VDHGFEPVRGAGAQLVEVNRPIENADAVAVMAGRAQGQALTDTGDREALAAVRQRLGAELQPVAIALRLDDREYGARWRGRTRAAEIVLQGLAVKLGDGRTLHGDSR